MTTSPSDPPDLSSPRRALRWLIGGAVVVVVAVVGTLLLTSGTDDSDDAPRRAGGTSTPGTSGEPAADDPAAAYDLSTPEAAAASFAAAAGTGSGDTLLELSCVGRLACVTEHVGDVSEEELTAGRDQIREGVFELGEHLKGVEFGTAVDGAEPGTKAVPYRTPAMTGDATLTFVQSEGDWLYYLPTT